MAAIHKKEHWTQLYRRALFEGDRNKLPRMLEQAHQAVQRRVSELRSSATQDQNRKERRDLDVAAHYLGLLRSLEAQQHWICLSQSIFQRRSSAGYGVRKRERIRGIGEIEQVDAA
jgi:hypothetical protein